MQTFPIKQFGSKLMASGLSINNIPDQYLSYSRNARIYDWGIWPRKGKQILTNSTIGTNNKGGFVLGSNLYQVTNSNIYLIDTSTGSQTLKATLGYDARIDVLVYDYQTETFTNLGAPQTAAYTFTKPVNKLTFSYATQEVRYYAPDNSLISTVSLATGNTGQYKASVKILNTTTNYQSLGTGTPATDGYILQDWQTIKLFPSDVPVVADNAARDALYPTPTEWLRVYNQAITAFQYYTSGAWTNQTVGFTGTNHIQTGYYTINVNSKALITSPGQSLQVFDGSSLIIPVTQPWSNSWYVEYCRGYSFLASGNVLYISAPITTGNPQNAYDFTGVNSQNITFDTTIKGIRATLDWVYIFTTKQVHLLDANSLQNVAGSATFISRPLGNGAAPIDNLCITASGNAIFYISENLHVQTVNYIQYTSDSTIWELSAKPVVGIRQYLKTLSYSQPTSFAHYNENDKTIQFHVRTQGAPYNDNVLVYDIINDTWNVDTQKNYNYVVKLGYKYYGFSDVNSSIYEDDIGYSDNGISIPFHIKTNNINSGTLLQKLYWWFYVAGGIWPLTDLEFIVNIDWQPVFADNVVGSLSGVTTPWEIGWDEIGWQPIGWDLYPDFSLTPFDRMADQWRISQMGTRIQVEVLSQSQIQNFILDIVGFFAQPSQYMDIPNKF